jgi:hypothetical protein
MEPHAPLSDLEVEPGRARLASLRDDLDHACRRFRSIERGRSRAFDDLDALDFVQVQVFDPLRAVRHPDAVDIDQRVGSEGKALQTADRDVRPLADDSRGLADEGSGDPPLKQVLHVQNWRSLNRFDRVDPSHGLSQRPHLRGARGPRDHDLVETDGLFQELDVEDRRFTRPDDDLLRNRSVTDSGYLYRVGTSRHVRDEEAPVGLREGAG